MATNKKRKKKAEVMAEDGSMTLTGHLKELRNRWRLPLKSRSSPLPRPHSPPLSQMCIRDSSKTVSKNP